MTKDKKEGFDLFSNFNTEKEDLWGNIDSSDPFGNSKNEDPFAMFPKEEPKKEEPKKNNDPFASLPVEPKKDDKVVPIKPGADKTPAKTDDKKAEDKQKDKVKDNKSKGVDTTKVAGDYGKEVVDESWTIAYAGHQLNPTHEMKLEEQRESMELDYPELSKNRTKWFVDKERKLAVPVVSGAKMG